MYKVKQETYKLFQQLDSVAESESKSTYDEDTTILIIDIRPYDELRRSVFLIFYWANVL
jgi:hypothetical protein